MVSLDLVFPPGPSAPADAALGRQLAQQPVVLGQLLLPTGNAKGRWLGQFFDPSINAYIPESLVNASGNLANSPALAKNATAGHINAALDADGVLRRYVPVVCWQSQCSVSLGLATVARAFSAQGWQYVAASPERGPHLALDGLSHIWSPLEPGRGFSVPWHQYRAIPVVSLHEVLSGRADPRLVNDRLVLVGSTAPGLADNVVTPVLSQMPGVMAHAVVASAIVESTLPRQPGWAWPLAVALYGVAALLLVLEPKRTLLSYWRLAGGALMGIAIVLGVGFTLYHAWGHIVPAAMPIVGVLALLLVQVARRIGQTNQDLIARMTAYLPAPLVRVLSRRNEPPPRLGWSTLLCADTVAYTSAAQELRPEQLAQWVNTGLDIVIRLVERRGGVIDNIAGDGLMAYWNQGSAEHQANQALRTAMVACRALQFASRQLKADGLPTLDMGLGLHAGLLLAGSYAAGGSRRYTIHGEAANLTQRIESATRQSPYRLLMSNTLAQIQTRYHPLSTDFTLTVGNASVPLYTITRKTPRRTA